MISQVLYCKGKAIFTLFIQFYLHLAYICSLKRQRMKGFASLNCVKEVCLFCELGSVSVFVSVVVLPFRTSVKIHYPTQLRTNKYDLIHLVGWRDP